MVDRPEGLNIDFDRLMREARAAGHKGSSGPQKLEGILIDRMIEFVKRKRAEEGLPVDSEHPWLPKRELLTVMGYSTRAIEELDVTGFARQLMALGDGLAPILFQIRSTLAYAVMLMSHIYYKGWFDEFEKEAGFDASADTNGNGLTRY